MRWVTLTGLILAAVTGVILWRHLALSLGNGTQGPNSSSSDIATSGNETTRRSPQESTERPLQILSVFPQEGGVACPTTEVYVRFRLEGAMLEEGVMDTAAFSLALDGEDVTAETKMLGTMDSPQSHGGLIYKPRATLPSGLHKATVTFPDPMLGRMRTYNWGFEVKRSACK